VDAVFQAVEAWAELGQMHTYILGCLHRRGQSVSTRASRATTLALVSDPVAHDATGCHRSAASRPMTRRRQPGSSA
jgi:hypothetical protein